MDIMRLQSTAVDVRIGIIKALHNAGSGHPGGSLSVADIVTALYFEEMNIDPNDPEMCSEELDEQFPDGMFRFEKVIR